MTDSTKSPLWVGQIVRGDFRIDSQRMHDAIIAYHEAGHALADGLYGFPIKRMRLKPEGGGGVERDLDRMAWPADAAKLVASLAAGTAATAFIQLNALGLDRPLFADGVRWDRGSDWEKAKLIAERVGKDEAWIGDCLRMAIELLGGQGPALNALASSVLLSPSRELDGDQVARIIAAHLR